MDNKDYKNAPDPTLYKLISQVVSDLLNKQNLNTIDINNKINNDNIINNNLICTREAHDILTREKKYHIVNSKSKLAPNVQVVLFLLDYIRTNIVLYKSEQQYQNQEFQKIINDDISIEINITSKTDKCKQATLIYKWDGNIQLIKNRSFKNYTYTIMLSP